MSELLTSRFTEGRVFSGLGRGAQFLALEWVRREIRKKAGFDPFPGTLNLRIDPAVWQALYVRREMFTKISDDSAASCPGFLLPVRLHTNSGSYSPGCLILPELTVYDDVLEIIAPEKLRDRLSVKDGDLVRVEECAAAA